MSPLPVRWNLMRRGQAAMEFLMTYGWAILVVLAAIGALAYFGVLSPDRFLPSKCVAQPPFSCSEHQVNSTAVTLVLQNNGGTDMESVQVTMTCDGNDAGAQPATAASLANGDSVTLVWTTTEDPNCQASAGARWRGNFSIAYTESGATISHTTTGSIQARGE